MTYKKIILASGSPRRHELLSKMGIEFEVLVPDVEEIIPEGLAPHLAPEYLAQLKAEAARTQFDLKNKLVITADTIVMHDGQILGKPKTKQEAFSTLQRLSGSEHQVITGVCLMDDAQKRTFSCETGVHFKEITPDRINYYIDRDQVLDKAGSYGIQDWIGMTHIESISGSYTNIMGLPTTMLYHVMYSEGM